MIEEIYKKRRKVKRFLNEAPDHNLIVDLMQKTHSLVPSKQNLMPYKIHVLGPKCLKLKDELYHLTTTASSDEYTQTKSNYQVYAPYVLIFTTRLAEPNEYVKRKIQEGHSYKSCFPETYLNTSVVNTACIEVGMWSKIFTGLCLENDIDVAYLKCFNSNSEKWSFIDERPLFVIGVGYKVNHAPFTKGETKPDWNEVVCFEHE